MNQNQNEHGVTVNSNPHHQCPLWYCQKDRNPAYCSDLCHQTAILPNPRIPIIKNGLTQNEEIKLFEKVREARDLNLPTGLPELLNQIFAVPPWQYQPWLFTVNFDQGETYREWVFLYNDNEIPPQLPVAGWKWRPYSLGKMVTQTVRLRRWVSDPQPNGQVWNVRMYFRYNFPGGFGEAFSVCFLTCRIA